jgi:hypothetical protein
MAKTGGRAVGPQKEAAEVASLEYSDDGAARHRRSGDGDLAAKWLQSLNFSGRQ